MIDIRICFFVIRSGILPDRPPAILRCQKIESIHFSSLTGKDNYAIAIIIIMILHLLLLFHDR